MLGTLKQTLYIVIIILLSLSGCSKKESFVRIPSTTTDVNLNELTKGMKDSKNVHKATLRPYVIKGKKYYPRQTYVGETFNGIASWYGKMFHGRLTSNGEIYDMYSPTAASKTLPMNTIVHVYNKKNSKSTVVRINDRGPFVDGRIIDLSKAAADSIDMTRFGLTDVQLTVLGLRGNLNINDTKLSLKEQKQSKQVITDFSLQVGSYSKITNAKNVLKKLNNELKNSKYNAKIQQVKVGSRWIHRVIIDGFNNKQEAYKYKMHNSFLADARIIRN